MITEIIRTYTTSHYTVIVEVVDFCQGSNVLSDSFEDSDCHIGGKTIQTPSYLYNSNCYEYWLPLNTTLSELSSYYSKKGIENPSKAAYESLQKELEHCIAASDCAIRCTIEKCGIKISQVYGESFAYSDIYGNSLEEEAKYILKDNGNDMVKEAIKEARATLTKLAA